MLAALAGLAAGAPRDAVVTFAAVAEIAHAATLVHDDVIDHGLERRGRPSVHVLVGNKRAVLGGDALLTTGLRQLTRRGLFRETDSLLACIAEMVEGEYLQMERQFTLPPDVAASERVNRLKTALLFGWCTAVSLAHVGAPEQDVRRAAEVGIAIGDAFQTIDDLLDLFGDPALTGKPVLQDLREGKITPLMGRLLLERPPLLAQVERYWRVLLRGEDAREVLAPLLLAAQEAGLEGSARSHAQRRLAEGLEQLSVFPVRAYAEALRAVAEPLLARQR
jgi:octaprenyl-diphosphate synthase